MREATKRGLALTAGSTADEIGIAVIPVVLGRGIPLFDGGIPVTSIKLLETTPYKGGAVGLRYAVIRARGEMSTEEHGRQLPRKTTEEHEKT